MVHVVEIKLILTNEEAVTLEEAICRAGETDTKLGFITEDREITNRGQWLDWVASQIRGQRRSQQKFDGG